VAWWHRSTLETLQVRESNPETPVPDCRYSLVESMWVKIYEWVLWDRNVHFHWRQKRGSTKKKEVEET
jgi:hypothetical protein